jgi:hypothetical protein
MLIHVGQVVQDNVRCATKRAMQKCGLLSPSKVGITRLTSEEQWFLIESIVASHVEYLSCVFQNDPAVYEVLASTF